MKLTTAQILGITRKKILENSTAIFSDDDLLLYINLAKDEVAKRLFTDDLITSTTLSFTGGVATKPTDFESHYMSKNSNIAGKGDVFEWVNREDYRNGKYEKMLSLINGSIAVFPTNTPTIYMDYYKKLPDLTVNTVDTGLDDALGVAVAYKTCVYAFEDLQDYELSKFFNDKFEVEFGIKGQAISYSNENSQNGGEMFNSISII